jgi:purine-nucleoside phosphorylase
MKEQIKLTKDFILTQIPEFKSKTAIVLGSGMGPFVSKLTSTQTIKYSDIPNFKGTSVAGHEGKLIYGDFKNTKIIVMQGRVHAYEGYSPEEVVFPIRVLAALGIENLFLTNAAGAINSNYELGEMVLIKDHINLTYNNPLIGSEVTQLGERFLDLTNVYDPNICQVMKDTPNVDLKDGIYCSLLGPSYETPAEVRMLSKLGVDLVGMSTTLEAIAARQLKMKVCALSCVTNQAAGIGGEELNHADIKEVALLGINRFESLMENTIPKV